MAAAETDSVYVDFVRHVGRSDDEVQNWGMREAFLYFGRHWPEDELWDAYYRAETARMNGERDVGAEERIVVVLVGLLDHYDELRDALARWR